MAEDWISIKDRLPDLYDPVLLCDNKRHIAVGRYTDVSYPSGYVTEFETDGISFNFNKRKVTHWMLLPEPPEQEETK